MSMLNGPFDLRNLILWISFKNTTMRYFGSRTSFDGPSEPILGKFKNLCLSKHALLIDTYQLCHNYGEALQDSNRRSPLSSGVCVQAFLNFLDDRT